MGSKELWLERYNCVVSLRKMKKREIGEAQLRYFTEKEERGRDWG